MIKETISYSDLAKRVGDCVLFNNHSQFNEFWYEGIYDHTPLRELHNEEIDNENTEGMTDDECEEYFDTHGHANALDSDIYQTYHITKSGAEYLLNHTSEIVSYCEKLDAFLWHICHYGTSWTHVHTYVYNFSDEENHEHIFIDEADTYMNN